MIARTSPTIWDVLIALFGGIAGAIGNTREKKGNVIPGVAIATALMPPLCTAGYGIASGQPSFFLGAFYLFLINTLFISLSTMIVTMMLRVPYHRNLSEKKQKKINLAIAAITIVAAVPSVFFGATTVVSSVMDNNISSYLNNEFVFSGTTVVKSSTDKSARTVSVSLVGTPISDDVIAMLQQEMPKYGLDGYTLNVTQNQMIDLPEDAGQHRQDNHSPSGEPHKRAGKPDCGAGADNKLPAKRELHPQKHDRPHGRCEKGGEGIPGAD